MPPIGDPVLRVYLCRKFTINILAPLLFCGWTVNRVISENIGKRVGYRTCIVETKVRIILGSLTDNIVVCLFFFTDDVVGFWGFGRVFFCC